MQVTPGQHQGGRHCSGSGNTHPRGSLQAGAGAGAGAGAMGNSVTRPGCLGQRRRRSAEPQLRDVVPDTVENGWSMAPGATGTLKRSPVPVQNGSTACVPVPGAAWTPHMHRGTWGWAPGTRREVTEVTEVTETIVTEIVEVTQYPGAEAPLTGTGTMPVERRGDMDAAEVTAVRDRHHRQHHAGSLGP